MNSAGAKYLKLQRYVVIAIGCYWAWIQSLFFNTAFSSNTPEATTVFLCNVGAHFFSLILFAIGTKRFAPYIERRTLVITSTVVVCVASIVIYVGATMNFLYAEAIGSLLAGSGSAVFLVLWGEAYAHIPNQNTRKTTIALSVLVAFMLFVIIANLPEILQVVAIAFAPIVCVMAATSAYNLPVQTGTQKDTNPRNIKAERTKSVPSWIRLLACTFLFSIPMAYFKTGTQGSNETASLAVVLLVLALIFIIDYFVRTKHSLTILPHFLY
ncbi:hypothetical protein [Eggerthella sp. YY7918]|uniref:hypothetical protein n=1 Tax=Eggerthella sp. (strain YY7918) TaxID=502558 RepID=UPI0005A00687|nr:hypothetical protein [Eggerthella sp. YY7918]